MTPTSFYAGSHRGILKISTWDELVVAVQAGSLAESQWVECKLAVPARSAGANLETAKDLASLTVDGGLLVIGVEDKATKAEQVHGATDIEGLKTRLAQIAGGTRIQPPMQVVFAEALPNPDEPGQAALLVSVPASPSAPHMVDSRYWGRGADGKRPLADREVSRLWAERRGQRDDFHQRLTALSADFDPFPNPDRRESHFYVAARPAIAPRVDLLDEIQAYGVGKVFGAGLRFHTQLPRYPNFTDLSRELPHPDGLGRYSVTNPTDDPAEEETQTLQALIEPSGTIIVMSGRGSETSQGESHVDLAFIVEIVHQTLSLAGYLGQTFLSYDGLWAAGVHAEGLRGRVGPLAAMGSVRPVRPFATDTYTRTCSATTADLNASAVAKVGELLGDFARGAGLASVRGVMDPRTSPLV